MKIVTATELKNKTGEIIRRARAGEQFLVTVHGKPVAAISPAETLTRSIGEPRPAQEAWPDIEKTLEQSAPRFANWQEATGWMRQGE